MITPFTVNLLTPDFANQIETIEKSCFDTPWSLASITESFENGTLFFGAVQDGTLIGYCSINVICGEGYINNLAVLPSYRKAGVGKRIITAICEHAIKNKYEFLTLEVRTSNLPAINLYRKCGFENIGTRKNFYRLPTEDSYIMTKQINSGEVNENSCN